MSMHLPYYQITAELIEITGPELAVLLDLSEDTALAVLTRLVPWALDRCKASEPPSANDTVRGPLAARLIARGVRLPPDVDADAFVDALASGVSHPMLERVADGIRVRGLSRYDPTWAKNNPRRAAEWRASRASGASPAQRPAESDEKPEQSRTGTEPEPGHKSKIKSKRKNDDNDTQVEPGEPAATAPRFLGPDDCGREGCGHAATAHAIGAPHRCLWAGMRPCRCTGYQPPPTVPTRRAPLAPDEPLVPPERCGCGEYSVCLRHLPAPPEAPAASGERRAPAESKPARKRKAPAGEPAPEVLRVFQHWQAQLGHPRAVLDAKRRGVIEARLAEGFTQERLCRAVDGCAGSAWHRGENDRRTPYDDLTLICRDAAHVEQFERMPAVSPSLLERAFPEKPPEAPAAGTPAGEAWARALEAVRAEGKTYALNWLGEIRPVDIVDGVLLLEARDRHAVAWVREHYADLLDRCVPEGLGWTVGAPEAAQAVAS